MERTCLAVILAAGDSTRMKSSMSKVLHPVAGRPMIAHVVEAIARTDASAVALVVGRDAEAVTAAARREGRALHRRPGARARRRGRPSGDAGSRATLNYRLRAPERRFCCMRLLRPFPASRWRGSIYRNTASRTPKRSCATRFASATPVNCPGPTKASITGRSAEVV